jgi:DNA polymerase III epsilon subunit-like protein
MSKNEGLPYVIVFDTETTGLSKTDVVIQLGYITFDRRGRQLGTYEKIWNTSVPSNRFALEVHRISHRETESSPHKSNVELQSFLTLVQEVHARGGRIVAHNAKFDTKMLNQTASQVGVEWIWNAPTFCTMESLRSVSKSDRGANLKNVDVYAFMGGPDLGEMHTALVDSLATAYIYYQGACRKWWSHPTWDDISTPKKKVIFVIPTPEVVKVEYKIATFLKDNVSEKFTCVRMADKSYEIRFDLGTYHLIIEMDKKMHGGTSIDQNEDRMRKSVDGPCIFIRCNTHNSKNNRQTLLRQVKKYLVRGETNTKFKVRYMFYR